MERRLICRAKVAGKQCYDGQKTSRQFGVMRDGGDPPMSEDGTFNGTSMICAPCLAEVRPFIARSAANPNTGLVGFPALNDGLKRYREAAQRVRSTTELPSIVVECETEMRQSSAFSYNYQEARAIKALALREEAKRKEADALRERVQARNEAEEAASSDGEAAPAGTEAASAETSTEAGAESTDAETEPAATEEEGTSADSETSDETSDETESESESEEGSESTETETEEQPA